MRKGGKNKQHFGAGNLLHVVNNIVSKKDPIFSLVKKHQTPFYVYDQKELDISIERFIKAFKANLPRFQPYYALKLNHHPLIINRVIKKEFGLDVASRRELSFAIKSKASKIIYFSPGKKEADLLDAIRHSSVVRIHVDSFNELHDLGVLTNKTKKHVELGVRVHIPPHDSWSKYGIPLSMLKKFWVEAKKYPFIHLNGIHFHRSRNRSVDFYTNAIYKIANHINTRFSLKEREEIKYVDFGGGFEPYCSEGILKGNDHAYNILVPPTIEEYAKAIGDSVKKHLTPLIKATYLSEPGRYICNNAMHIVLSVVDIKDKGNYILDGGVNMVGWQRFEKEYFPLINISNPSKKELPCHMWGNLCTTWDIWGYHCYTKKVSIGDIIIVPYQGALTYSLAQSFINNIPPVYKLPKKR